MVCRRELCHRRRKLVTEAPSLTAKRRSLNAQKEK
jgi:hypothetical protein